MLRRGFARGPGNVLGYLSPVKVFSRPDVARREGHGGVARGTREDDGDGEWLAALDLLRGYTLDEHEELGVLEPDEEEHHGRQT